MGRPEISVVLPTYNRSRSPAHQTFLAECVKSLCNQECEVDFELLIATELPQDNWINYRPFFEGLVATTDNVKIVLQHHQPKTGHGVVDNDLYAMARGRYITRPLGDDEIFEPHMLQKLYEALEADERNVLAYGDFVDINIAGQVLRERRRGEHSHDRLQRECYVGICVMLDLDFWRSQGMFWSPMLAGEDWDAWKRLSTRCEMVRKKGGEPRWIHVPEVLGRWRDWQGNLTAKVRAGEIEAGKVYE